MVPVLPMIREPRIPSGRFKPVMLPWLVFACLSPALHAGAPQKTGGARIVVEHFCQAEFDGRLDIRLDTVKYSQTRLIKERKRDPDFAGRVIYCDNDPLRVVASFRIEATTSHGAQASVWVSFRQLASTRGDGQEERVMMPDPKAKDLVRYDLRNLRGKWWIINPPIPRVSRDGLIAAYQKLLSTVPPRWFESPDVTDDQKKVVRKQMETLDFLRSLPPS